MPDKEPFNHIIKRMSEDDSISFDEFGKKLDNIEALKEIQSYQDKIKKFKDAIEVCERRIGEILKSLKRKG